MLARMVGIAFTAISALEDIFLGKARQAIFNREELINQQLTLEALNDPNGVAVARLGFDISCIRRNLVVIVPTSTKDLLLVLNEVNKEPEGRTVLNPMASLMGHDSMVNTTGLLADSQRKILLPYTRDVKKYLELSQQVFPEVFAKWSAQTDGFVLLDEVKFLIRSLTVTRFFNSLPLSHQENQNINNSFRYIKQSLINPFSVVVWLSFFKERGNYRELSKKFMTDRKEAIKVGLNQKGMNVVADLIQNESEFDSKNLFNSKTSSAMFVAGAADGIAPNLIGILIQLIQQPEMANQLYSEIKNAYDALDDKENFIDQVKILPFLDAVLNESFRFYSSPPVLPRFTRRGIQSDTINVPPCSTILINLRAMHHNPKNWGPRAHLFDPAHFLPENKNKYEVPFTPFSLGGRQCPGAKVGELVIKFFVCELLLKYELEAIPGQAAPGIDNGSSLALDIAPGYLVKLRPRIEAELDKKYKP